MFKRTTAINKILALRKRKKVIQGGTSAGKTFGIIPILIDRACKAPLLEISVVSESIPHLRRGALKDFLKIMKATGRYIEANYNKTHLKYTFTNGSFIEFFSADQEANVRGPRRNILYINECNNLSFQTYHQLAIRTTDDIYLDYNPSHEFWVQTELMQEDDVDFLILTYKDNEALPDSIVVDIEKAKAKAATSKYWENWWNVYGLGQMGTIEGVVFGEFKHCSEFPADCKWIGYGLDFGYTNDPTTIVKVGLKNGELYLQQLLYQTGLTNSDLDAKMKELGIGRGEIVADSADPKSIEELRRLGWNIRAAVKGKDSIVNGIDLIKRYPVNIISDSLELIKEWRGYMWKYDKALNKYINEPMDALNHCIDAIRYILSFKMVKPAGSPIATNTRRR